VARVEGIGPVKAPAIVDELVELAPVIARLEVLGGEAGGKAASSVSVATRIRERRV